MPSIFRKSAHAPRIRIASDTKQLSDSSVHHQEAQQKAQQKALDSKEAPECNSNEQYFEEEMVHVVRATMLFSDKWVPKKNDRPNFKIDTSTYTHMTSRLKVLQEECASMFEALAKGVHFEPS
jgi:hypothetical protein